MFNHVKVEYELPELNRHMENGERVYYDNEGNRYESTTNVVGFLDRSSIIQWRNRVGEAVADNITERATTLGTKLHNSVELYLKNEITTEKNIFANAHLENLKPLLNNINNIKGLEVRLCSKTLGLAGTADCIAEYNGVPSIIDFKTAGKKKRVEWIKKYFMQTTAYSLMWEELTGEKIDQIVILMTVEEGGRVEFIKQREDYVTDLNEIIELFKVGGSLISY